VDVHVHLTDPRVDTLVAQLSALQAQVQSMNADITAKLADLQAKVAADASAEQSAITLLQGLAAQIAALKTTTTDPAVLTAIDGLSSSLSAQTSGLAAAVIANTPA
jgi:hypothetical protein